MCGQKLSIEGSVIFLSLVLLRQRNVLTDSKGKRCMLNGSARPRLVKAPSVKKRWIPPAYGALKINVDGAFHHESGKAVVGVIIRDDDGLAKLIAWRILCHCRDAEEAEAAAYREDIAMAARWPDLPMVLQTDCSVFAEKLKSKEKDCTVAWSILNEA